MSISLQNLLYKVPILAVSGSTDVMVDKLTFDSRIAGNGSVFFAIEGTITDGHRFIDQVIEQDCKIIVHQNTLENYASGITYVQVKNSAYALGIAASNFFGNPSDRLIVVGITGTNGKTSTATLLYKLYKSMGFTVGLLSTVQNIIDEEVYPSTHTTPDQIQLQKLMQQMINSGCTHCFMEVSSHALAQQRVAGIQFNVGVFTNITHDHLDFHKTFDQYIAAKKLLFDHLPSNSFALVNSDDKRSGIMVQNTRAKIHTYALLREADFRARLISHTLQGMEIEIDQKQVWFALTGRFNAYNLLAVYATSQLLGEDSEKVLTHLSKSESAKGRFDQIASKSGIHVIVDYAHTPDALQKVLETITELRTRNEQVLTVVGCGGNRDAEKRPLMAQIATRYSDKVIFTSDNPRKEDPEAILNEMMHGVSPSDFKKAIRITDRKEAIKTALMFCKKGDIVLIAGKGHEDYQEINGVKYPFDDKKVATEILNQIHPE